MVTQECAPALYAALVEAKREMWMSARHQWNLSDFNNWAVIQQINAALTLTDGKPRDGSAPAKLPKLTGEEVQWPPHPQKQQT